MDQIEEEQEKEYHPYRYSYYNENESEWFTNLVYDPLSFLFSPAILLSQSYRKAQQTADSVHSAVIAAPSAAAAIARRLALGVFGAAYACTVLIVVLGLAVVLGVGFVRILVDEPVMVKQNLNFDYTEANPTALFWFGHKKIPTGHTFSVSVELLVPESDFNTHLGVFQISVEVLSSNGYVMGKSSLPCMLRFRSWPVRFARTLIMSVPLVLGLTGETQRIRVDRILRHKEGHPRTNAVRVAVIPRSGTDFLPQIYEATVVIASKLPWHRNLVRRWKWTLSVWFSIYAFVLLVAALLCFCRSVFFPARSRIRARRRHSEMDEDENEQEWRFEESKRKVICLGKEEEEQEEEETITYEALEDDDGDSESVC